MPDEVLALVWRHTTSDGAERLPERIDGAQRHLAQQRLKLGEDLLDRI